MALKKRVQNSTMESEQNLYETTFIPIEKIVIKRTELRVQKVDTELVESIKTIGLMNPLIVSEDFELLAGGRRYAACRELNMKSLPVRIFKNNGQNRNDRQEIAHLDENLVRRNLEGIELDRALVQRKKMYESIYPSAKKGGDRKSEVAKIKSQNSTIDSFVDDTAKRTGKSKTTIKDSIRRFENATELVTKARENGILNDSKTNLLVTLSPKKQDELLQLAISLPVDTLKQIIKLSDEYKLSDLISEINHGTYLKTFAVIASAEQFIKDSEALITSALGISTSVAQIINSKLAELDIATNSLFGYLGDKLRKPKSKPIPVEDLDDEHE